MWKFIVLVMLVAVSLAEELQLDCTSLLPIGKNSSLQQTTQRWGISFPTRAACTFHAKQELTVELGGKDRIFNYYAIQARIPYTTEIVGSWIAMGDNQKVRGCSHGSMNNTLVNNGVFNGTKVPAKWVAPWKIDKDKLKKVEFVAGVAMADGETYWSNALSPMCEYKAAEPVVEEVHNPPEETDQTDDVHSVDRETDERPADKDVEEESQGGSDIESERADYERNQEKEQPGAIEREREEAESRSRDLEGDKEDGDDHDADKEEELYARQKQKEEEEKAEEDKNAQGEDAERREYELHLAHQAEVDKEAKDFEEQTAKEDRERQERIRLEIVDKEQHDLLIQKEKEEERKKSTQRPDIRPSTTRPRHPNEVDIDDKNRIVADEKKTGGSSVIACSVFTILLGLLISIM